MKIITETKSYKEAACEREPKVGDKVLIKAGTYEFIEKDQIVEVAGVRQRCDNTYAVHVYNKSFLTPHTKSGDDYTWSFFSNEYTLVEEVSTKLVETMKKPKLVDRIAQPGEYIILKYPIFSFDRPGDILKVSETTQTSARVKSEDHPAYKYQWIYDLIYDFRNEGSAKNPDKGAWGRENKWFSDFPKGTVIYDGLWNYTHNCYLVIENYDPEETK